MNFFGKKILVLGAGASGISAAGFLARHKAVVGIYDDKMKQVNNETNEINPGSPCFVHSIPEAIYISSIEQVEFEKFDFCVISPGISINHPVAKMFNGRIISELALGANACRGKIIAVTGTNGKTTVTGIISDALGKRGLVCGNIGVPITSVTAQTAGKYAVTEVSSFMLEAPGDFSADIGVILNITQDHLERHGTMQEYTRCKTKLAQVSKTLILNYDDENCRMLGVDNTLFFSAAAPVRGIYSDGKNIILNLKKRPKVLFKLNQFGEKKPHEISNILAVILVCVCLGAGRRRILKACNGHKSNENRIQYVRSIGNAAFYNDSKATNIAACLTGCRCFKSPINLLVGGQTKGQNFVALFEKLPSNVDHIFCFGSGADVIAEAAAAVGYKKISNCKDMSDAVNQAFNHGFGPRVVLLSPACASLDQFKNYAERGRKFMQTVRELAENKTNEKSDEQDK